MPYPKKIFYVYKKSINIFKTCKILKQPLEKFHSSVGKTLFVKGKRKKSVIFLLKIKKKKEKRKKRKKLKSCFIVVRQNLKNLK